MAIEEKGRRTEMQSQNHVILENRERLSVSGVTDVESYNENDVTMQTSMGMLIVRGSNLHIEKLNLESGELAVMGEISALEYEDRPSARGGLFARLFG